MLEALLSASLLAAIVRQSAPLVLAGLGGLCSERSGVVNIALEGIMTCGAIAAACVARYTGNPWWGLAAGAVSGCVLALAHAVFCISGRVDHIVSGTAINILALGAPTVALSAIWPDSGGQVAVPQPFEPWSVPLLSSIPVLGPAFFRHTVPLYLAYGLPLVLWFALGRTRWGLRLRAVGDAPETIEQVGLSVTMLRYSGVLLSGVAAGAAGSLLVLSLSSEYVRGVAAGRGFIALAALIFGRWRPLRTTAACVAFGAATAVAMRLQGTATLPPAWVQLTPYVLTLLVLILSPGRTQPPAALGRPYHRLGA